MIYSSQNSSVVGQKLFHEFHIQSATVTIHSGLTHPFVGKYDGSKSGFTIFEDNMKRLRHKMAKCLMELKK